MAEGRGLGTNLLCLQLDADRCSSSRNMSERSANISNRTAHIVVVGGGPWPTRKLVGFLLISSPLRPSRTSAAPAISRAWMAISTNSSMSFFSCGRPSPANRQRQAFFGTAGVSMRLTKAPASVA